MSYGLSPRVRGTVELLVGFDVEARFIPARAGNGTSSRPRKWPTTVHPRAYGERDCNRLTDHRLTGSSPRVRGTGIFRLFVVRLIRFIPARAGNGYPAAILPAGSSPRVRGTVRTWEARRLRNRFIPARAGNGCMTGRPRFWPAVHPRAYGERALPGSSMSAAIGSSPRVRGTGLHFPVLGSYHRFIPARTGNGRH